MIDIHANRRKDRQTEIKTDLERQVEEQADRQTKRKTDLERQADGQTDR